MEPIERVRRICLALPSTSERDSHGSPSFFVHGGKLGKQFCSIDDHHHSVDHVAFWAPAPPGAQEALIASDATAFFRPPYVGHRGWVGVRIDLGPDWDELAEILRDAYRTVAPKSLGALLD